jgi:small subunit ribosomal protein S12
MATINQLIKAPRVPKTHSTMIKALGGSPYKRGICLRVLTTKPKKPNSAIRKIAKVLLSNKRRITAAIPGIGHSLQEHASVLVRSGRANDLPGVRFKLVRGKLDFASYETYGIKQKRSKYGVKKSK